ncbi:hypothetical protein JCM10213_007373 [Rhodosporidiobolus nylandii]
MAQTGQEHLPTSLLDHTLRTAPLNVVYGFTASTVLGAAAGATSGVLRNAPAIPAAFQTGVNTAAFSFTFFSIREYAVIPLLTTFSLHPSPLPSPTNEPPAASSPHTHNLLPTTIAGVFAGTAFSYFRRPATPAATHARAGLTLALGCAVLQGIVNEGDVIRIKLLAWGEERERAKREAASLPAPAPSSPSSSLPAPSSATASPAPAPATSYLSDLTNAPHPSSPSFSDPGRETFSERSDRLFGDAWGWVKTQASKVAPLKRMEEGEYEKKMQGLLAGVEEEKKRVERERMELEALEKMLEKVDARRAKQ